MSDVLRTRLLNIGREQLLDILDKGARFVEIGVAEGDFSQEILARCRPSALALVDPWIAQDDPSYAGDINNVPSRQQEERFRSVCKRFESDKVDVLRMSSLAAAPLFEDASLDYVYIDGNHSHDAVQADLEAWWPKLKADGLLLGHDYANHFAARHAGFGVVEAVNEFVVARNAAFVAITNENYPYPTFILAKSWHAKAFDIIDRAPVLCSFDASKVDWDVMQLPDGSAKIFLRF